MGRDQQGSLVSFSNDLFSESGFSDLKQSARPLLHYYAKVTEHGKIAGG